MSDRPLAFDPAALGPGDSVDAYRLEGLLGAGALALTFLARLGTGQPVVLKIARRAALVGPWPEDQTAPLAFATGAVGHWDADPARVLRAEADALARVDHPALPRLVAEGEAGGLSYLVRTYGPGEPLRGLLQRGEQPLQALRHVAVILEEVAGSGSLPCHGDLKPENVIVAPNGLITIIDPAAPAAAWGEQGELQALLATPAYNLYLELNDVTPLGVMLYETLAGLNPFLLGDGEVDWPRQPLSPELVALLEQRAAAGRAGATRHIPYLIPPPDLAPDDRLLAVAMRAMGLAFAADGSIDLCPRHRTVGEFAYELAMALDTRSPAS